MKITTACIALLLTAAACTSEPAEPTTVPVEAVTTTIDEGATMELSSPEFDHEGPIPAIFTCDGDDVSPELRIDGIPDEAAVLVVIMDDPDAPNGTWDHWVAYDIPPVAVIRRDVGDLGTGGLNSWKKTGYGGPCPPSGTHRYFFTVLALDAPIGIGEGADKIAVLNAADGHVLAEATLMGTYAR